MENQNELRLSKESTSYEIKMYFQKVLELSKTNDEFPVSLDEVWPLIYSRKQEAVRALCSNEIFIQGVDYQFLRRNAQNSLAGRPVGEYYLSVSCMEFFIARKVKEVFEVYRQVFHSKVTGLSDLSDTEILARSVKILMKRDEEQKLMLQQANEMIQASNEIIKQQKPKADFYDYAISDDKLFDMSEVAKIINFKNVGRNKLFEILRNEHILMADNRPYQKYVASGSFEMKIVQSPNNNETYSKTFVTKKGIKAIIALLRSYGFVKTTDLPVKGLDLMSMN